MIIWFIIFTAILALLTDFYIYRRVLTSMERHWRKAYIIYAAFIDVLVIVALLWSYKFPGSQDSARHQVLIWIVFVFFLHAVPKFIYFFFALFDHPVEKFGKRSSRRVFGKIGFVLSLVVALVILWGGTFGRTRIKVVEMEIASEKLPASFDGFKVAFFTDTHIGNLINPGKILGRMADSINKYSPDIVINGGDLVNIMPKDINGPAYRALSRIESKYGIYSVLGNHDLGFYINDTATFPPVDEVHMLLDIEKKLGWTPLVNSSEFLSNGRDSITISGIDFPIEFKHRGHVNSMAGVDYASTYENVPDSLFNLTISHAPQPWDDILNIGKADLTLAGHVHAMQFKINIGKWKWSPSRFMYKRWSGLYEEDGKYLYINDGIGYVIYPMRIGTRPEVTIITLRSIAR